MNALGYLRVMFAVDDLEETLARHRKRGAQLVSSDVVQYEDAYRLCYIRGSEGLSLGSPNNSAERMSRYPTFPRGRTIHPVRGDPYRK